MPWFRKQEVVKIEANLAWEVFRNPKNGRFIGVCRALNLNAAGDTWGEFQECANETIQLLFLDLFRQGELEQFLRRRGWHIINTLPKPGSTPRFDVPFDLARKARFDELVPA